MARPHPRLPSDMSASLRRTAQHKLHKHSTIIAPSGSSLTSNFTPSHRPNARINHGTHLPARHVSLGKHHNRPLSVPDTSNPIHHEARGKSRPSSSPMTSRTLSSGRLLFYLRDAAVADHTVEELREKLVGPLGFDIEWRPNFAKGQPPNRIALVQLASDSVVLLVQVSAMSAFPEKIKGIIEDPTIIKAGVGIQGDADKLCRDFGVDAASCLELSYLARVVDQQWAATYGLISLTRLVKAYEDRNLQKPKRIQLSNWELYLTEEQQDYAASDAIAALSVLQELYVLLPSVQPPPAQTLYLF